MGTQSTPVGIHATNPKALAYRPERLDAALARPDYAAMDDTAAYAQTLRKPIPADPDDVFSEADHESDAPSVLDVAEEMRILWSRALGDLQMGGRTPTLPTVDAGKLVLVPITTLVGTLMDLHVSIQLLCTALATADTGRLHAHLRDMWVDGYAQELANIGWRG